MNTERSARVEELFNQIADAPPSEHRRLLQEACGDDPQMVDEVMALLQADAAGGHQVLGFNVAEMASRLLDPATPPIIPGRFDRYIIREYLNHGGMGWVYLAERDGLGDRVAVKFLHDAWSSPADRERFTREQQTLASLNHPGIARLYDAGVANGTPWFAMEYVEGMRITDFCRHHELGLRERLNLFRSVCEAVAYAHRNLTVHLDLKPSNILVNTDGHVKLLDFGIARNLDRESGQAEKTRTGLRLFSLNYAAPEQIRGEALDVQTDVHGLGIILYELLIGRTPADLTDAGAAELLRYAEEEVKRPSVARGESSGTAVQASPSEWSDLDVLCSTALHRDRARRYESTGALIRDLDHFVKDEPLQAQADSARYRIGKFLKRRRREVAATTAIIAAVLALSLFFTIRLIHARDRALFSEARTQRIYRLMLNLFEGDDGEAGPGQGLRVVELLDRGVQAAEGLSAEPALQTELRYTFGSLYHRLGRLDRAEPLFQSALQNQQRISGPQSAEAAKDQLALAALYIDQTKFDEAQRLAQNVLSNAQTRYGPGSAEAATAQATLGKVFEARGDYKLAVPLLENAVKVLSKAPESTEFLEALNNLGNTYYYVGNLKACEDANRRSLELDQKRFGERHAQVSVDLYNLGGIQLDRGRYQEAEKLYQRALEIARAWYGDVHPQTANNLLMIGRALRYQGRLDEAAEMYNQALAVSKAAYGEHTMRFAVVLGHLGDLAKERNQLDQAEKYFRQAAETFGKTVGEKHEFYAHQLSNIGSVYVARRQYEQAEKILRPALQSLQASVPNQRYTGLAEMRLAAALTGQQQYGEAEQHALAGYAILLKQTAPSSAEVQDARKQIYALYMRMNQPVKAAEFRAK